MYKDIIIFTGNSNPKLAKDIAKELKCRLGDAEVKKFADGETFVDLHESVRAKDVFIVQPTCNPVNDNLMELLIMVDAAKRASAGRITAVIPYFGYSKQDRKADHWEPITAKLVANLITAAGADGVLTMDLHAQQIQGFFDIPTDILYASKVIIKYFKKKKITQGVVVAPDVGSSKRARSYAKRLGFDLAIVDKRRPKPNVSEVMHLIGDVEGKTAILVDDEINTAGTMVNAAEALLKNGAKEVYAAASHGVFAGSAVKLLKNSVIKEVVVSDSIAVPKEKMFPQLKQVSVASMFAEGINNIHKGVSVSEILNPSE